MRYLLLALALAACSREEPPAPKLPPMIEVPSVRSSADEIARLEASTAAARAEVARLRGGTIEDTARADQANAGLAKADAEAADRQRIAEAAGCSKCRSEGLCKPQARGAPCRADSDDLCLVSKACAEHERCVARAGRCVAP